jgi:protein SCO1/2
MKPIPFLITAMILAMAGCSPNPGSTTGVPPCCRPALPSSTPLTDRSIYHLESVWTSDAGKTLPLSHFRGRTKIVALFFTHCEFACPILVNDLQRIEAALPAEAREKVDFLLVSIDPTRDTPKRLREFRAEKSLGLQHWTLLTGAEDDVRELAALLGVNYQRDARGQYAHSNLITVLGPDGEVVSQLKGLNQSIDELVRQIVTTHSQP